MVHRFENLEIIVCCNFLTGFDVSWTLVILCFFILYIYIYILKGFLCNSPGFLESQFVYQVGFKVTEICFPLPLSPGIKHMGYHAWQGLVIYPVLASFL